MRVFHICRKGQGMRTGSLIILLVVLALICTGSLSAGGVSQADKALVRVLVKADTDFMKVQAAGLEVYARLNTVDGVVLLGGADSSGIAALESQGFSLRLLDAKVDGEQCYVAYLMPGRAAPDWTGYGDVLYEDATHAIMRMSSEDAQKLAEVGVELRAVTLDVKPIRAPGRRSAFLTSITPDSLIQEMINQVDSATVYQYTGDLSGEWPATIGGEQYTIVTRHTYSGTPIEKATQYVGEHLEGLGLSLEYHQWGGATYPSVIGELEGEISPDSIVIICGHLDDMPSGAVAPGADDNASGSTAILIAADIMTEYQWHYTLRFALWTGEEQGLWGSYYYAQRCYNLGEPIVGVLNLDMIAYNTVGSNPEIDLHADSSMPETIDLAQLFADVVSAYNLNLIPQIVPNGTGASDHASFWEYGYTAILGIEDFEDFNPRYHTTGDLLQYVDMDYYVEFVRASVGTFAHMAGVRGDYSGTDDYVVDGTAAPAPTLLHPGYPNPVVASTVIRYDIAEPCAVALRIYDVQGRLIRVLTDGDHAPGRHEVTWNGGTRVGDRSSPGVYFYTLTTDTGITRTQKVVLLK
jgi:hypothetical protein